MIAVRWPYHERYGFYNIDTNERLPRYSSQKAPDSLVGDDHIMLSALRWSNERWYLFTLEDLYAVRCTTPDCVDTLHSFRFPNKSTEASVRPSGENASPLTPAT